MTPKTEKILAAVAAALVIALAWTGAVLLGLEGAAFWILGLGLTVLAIAAIVVLWMMRWRKQISGADIGETGEHIDLLLRDADKRLASSAKSGAAKLRSVPLVFLFGETGSAKTTTLTRSGIDAELLAGQANQDGNVVPTRYANFWYAAGTAFAEMGGGLLNDENGRKYLIRRLAPVQSSVGGKATPRAALLCVDAESLVRAGAGEELAKSAAKIRQTLGEMCQAWGVNVPLYVIFTRLDRVPHFLEYAGALSEPEAGAHLGARFAMEWASAGAVYADTAANTLGSAFDYLLGGLEERRIDLLPRESNADLLPRIYQFPREFRKLKNNVLRYVADAVRPSQLSTNPLLRGMYFTGVRPVIITEAARTVESKAQHAALATDATGIFATPSAQAAPAAARGPVTRKVPQWVFLAPVLPAMILGDRTAFGASQTSVKVNYRRRIALALGAVAAVVFAIGWTVSYSKNSALEEQVTAATQAVAGLSATVPPSADSLQKLDALRAPLAQLREWEVSKPPMSYRWGLYAGHGLYRAAHDVYFNQFRKLLLTPAQDTLVTVMNKPSGVEGLAPARVYDSLKAYLLTTSHTDRCPQVSERDHSCEGFLAPVLEDARTKMRRDTTSDLAERQFRFYAQQLLVRNPFPNTSKADAGPVTTARRFLGQSSTADTIYQAMLRRASEKNTEVRFNQQFPGSAASVVNNYPVPGAFTANGWTMMQGFIGNPDEFFRGEQWVMGDQAFASLNRDKLQADLREQYKKDFLRHWREYLKATRVVPYNDARDGAAKLDRVSNTSSPLLMSLCVAALNTNVDSPDVAGVFGAVRTVIPQAGCVQNLADKANDTYRGSLVDLKVAFDDLANNPANEGARAKANDAASTALANAAKFPLPRDVDGASDREVARVLQEPIQFAKPLIEGAVMAPVNGAGASFCSAFHAVMAKYPFSSKSQQQATVGDFNSIFAPEEGALWRFYNEKLAKLLPRAGSDFSPATVDGMTVAPGFLSFFRRAAAVSTALYKPGSKDPQIAFGVKPSSSTPGDRIQLSINGQTERTAGPANWQFSWPGKGPQEVRLKVNDLDYPSYSGLWAVFQFFNNADKGSRELSPEWTLMTSGGPVTQNGKPVTVKLDINMSGAPPIFRPGYFAELRCAGPVVQKAR
jgi:type VI secretion system protein ImpL